MAKADKALAARRVEDVLRIRLDGAEWWDVVAFVREKEREERSAWFVADGATPLSDGMIRKYQEKADRLVEQPHENSRKKLFRRHLAKRRNLYARAVTTGDLRTGLACLRDEAAMLSLYNSRPRRPPGEAGEIDRKQRLAESVAFYAAVVCSDAPLAERMKAQERIDRLLGLECIDLEERLTALEQALGNKNLLT